MVTSRVSSPTSTEIEEGATVRHRRKIITIPDLSRIQVTVKLPESIVDRIEPNMKARIRVDAFPDEVLTGTVRDVAPRPDRSDFNKSGIKVYPTHVEIDQTTARPSSRHDRAGRDSSSMSSTTCSACRIKAVLAYDGKYHVAVKKPGGGFEWRDVSLGLANDEQVEVWEGIKSGETVIVNPITLMSEEERKAKLGDPPRLHCRSVRRFLRSLPRKAAKAKSDRSRRSQPGYATSPPVRIVHATWSIRNGPAESRFNSEQTGVFGNLCRFLEPHAVNRVGTNCYSRNVAVRRFFRDLYARSNSDILVSQ